MVATLGASLAQSRLDYSNSIMCGMSASNMHKLQSAQNSLTRVVLPSLRRLSASERLSYLHWFFVYYRIQFKIATLTHKTLAACQPSYLCNLLQVCHHYGLFILQLKNFSRCHTYPLTSVGLPSATALLQHGIQFILPLKIVPPYQVPRQVSPHNSLTINILRPATWQLPAPPIHDLWLCAHYKFSSSSYYYY